LFYKRKIVFEKELRLAKWLERQDPGRFDRSSPRPYASVIAVVLRMTSL
jgi:hypothetical protein